MKGDGSVGQDAVAKLAANTCVGVYGKTVGFGGAGERDTHRNLSLVGGILLTM